MRRLPPLSALRAFEAAARHGSFKRAARELAVTPTAVSHQIRSLEEHTGVTLFDRQVRQVVLTDAGAALYPVLRDGFDAFEAALERVTQASVRPQVTLSATRAFTARWLVPRLGGFRERHPGVDVVLHASDDTVDLAGGGADLAIRYGRGPYPGLTADVLFADRFAPVASPGLGVRSPEDLARVALIHFQWRKSHPDNPTWEAWFRAAGQAWASPPGQLRFSDEGHAIEAAVAGQGVALLSLALVGDELAAGRLVQPFGPTLAGHTYHLVASTERPLTASAQAAAHWLREQAAMASISMSAAGS